MPKLSPNPNPKTESNPKGAGAPKIEIDMILFERAFESNCTKIGICALFSISEKTLNRIIAEYYGDSYLKEFEQTINFSLLSVLKREKGKAMQNINLFNDSLKPKSVPAIKIYAHKVFTGFRENEFLNQNNDPINITITQVPFKPNNEYDAAD